MGLVGLVGLVELVGLVGLMWLVRFVDFSSLVGARESPIPANAATGLGEDRRGQASESKRRAAVSFGG